MQKRKPVGSPYVPQNSLNNQNPTTAKPKTYGRSPNRSRKFQQLSTETKVGDNVLPQYHFSHSSEEPMRKRRRFEEATSSPVRDQALISSPALSSHKPDAWFSRQVEARHGQEDPTRRQSIIVIDSQESVKSSHLDDIGNLKEARAVDSMLNPKPKKVRKPKTSSASHFQDESGSVQSLSQSSRRQSVDASSSHAAHHEDTMDVVEAESVPRRLRAPTRRGGQEAAHITQSSPVRHSDQSNDNIQVKSSFDALYEKQRPWQNGDRKRLGQDRHGDASRTIQRQRSSSDATPKLSATFRRDTGPSKPSNSGIAEKVRKGLEQKTTAVLDDDGSEDELSRDHFASLPRRIAFNPPRPADRSGVKEMGRSPSPNDIKHTQFTNTDELPAVVEESEQDRSDEDENDENSMHLKLLRIGAEDMENDRLRLRYVPEERAFRIEINRQSLVNPKLMQPWRLTSIHAQIVLYSEDDPSNLRVVLTGSKDGFAHGKICLVFSRHRDLTFFIERLQSSFGNRVHLKRKNNADMERAFVNATSIIVNETRHWHDPELLAMQKRQNLHEDSGNQTLPEKGRSPASATMATRRSAMQKTAIEENGSSPSSKQKSESSKPGCTSQRIQSKQGEVGPAIDLELGLNPEPEPKGWTKQFGVPKWDSPLIFPPTGPKRTTVDAQDIERLDDGEFLNDNIVSFALRQMEENIPNIKGKVHIFNTFFYTSLSKTKTGKRGFNYESVKRWTKDIDLFAIPYIVVPVNVDLHWFVTIICNLDKLEKKLDLEDEMLDNDIEGSSARDDLQVGVETSLIDLGSEEEHEQIPPPPKSENLSQGVSRLSIDSEPGQQTIEVGQNDDNNSDVFGFDNVSRGSGDISSELPDIGKLKPASNTQKGKKKTPVPAKRYHPSQPSIITLDSLGGAHYQEVRHLKDYVVAEALDKRGMAIQRDDIQGVVAKGIPEQTNYCDCGVYLIGYVEEFLKRPEDFVRKVLSRELEENFDFQKFDPSDKRTVIREDLLELAEIQKKAKILRKKQALAEKKAAQKQLGNSARGNAFDTAGPATDA
ncbi:hypothetical protein MBLNU459_g1535t1 [Dothideomycetes sp. NU459]